MALRHRHAVEVLHHHGDQSARRDFHFGARHGFGGDGHPVIRAFAGSVDIAVHVGQVGVDVRPVVSHEDAGIGPVGLCVDVAVLPIEAGQESGLGLHLILVRDAGGNIGGEQLLAVGLGAVQGLLQGQGERRARGRGLGVSATIQGQDEAQHRQYARHLTSSV